MSSSTTSATRRRRSALKAACLTAGLVTAFGAAPHEATAVAAATGLQATNGSQSTPIYDGYLLNTSPSFSLDVPVGSPVTIPDPFAPAPVTPIPASSAAPTGADSVVVFTAADASNLSGQSFESAFLTDQYEFGTPTSSPPTYSEAQVANYIASGFTDPNTTDQDAYDQFLDNLYYKYYSGPQTDTISAYEFTNGQYVGTVDPSQLPGGNTAIAGFGLTGTAVPEPGSLPLLMAGGLVLAGITIKRRRRSL